MEFKFETFVESPIICEKKIRVLKKSELTAVAKCHRLDSKLNEKNIIKKHVVEYLV